MTNSTVEWKGETTKKNREKRRNGNEMKQEKEAENNTVKGKHRQRGTDRKLCRLYIYHHSSRRFSTINATPIFSTLIHSNPHKRFGFFISPPLCPSTTNRKQGQFHSENIPNGKSRRVCFHQHESRVKGWINVFLVFLFQEMGKHLYLQKACYLAERERKLLFMSLRYLLQSRRTC